MRGSQPDPDTHLSSSHEQTSEQTSEQVSTAHPDQREPAQQDLDQRRDDLDLWPIINARMQGEINFREAVYRVTAAIPSGRVLGYGQVASLLGSPRAARQVGFALGALSPERASPDHEAVVPWWRVLRTSGHIALKGDPIRPELQRALLRDEGVVVNDYRVDMTRYQWLDITR